MKTSPKLKYPLVAGIGNTKRRVTTATRAAKMAAAAILNEVEGVYLIVLSFVCLVTHHHSVMPRRVYFFKASHIKMSLPQLFR